MSKDEKQTKYLYEANVKMILKEKKPIQIHNVLFLSKTFDYFNNFYPVLKMAVNMTNNNALDLQENLNSVYFIVELYLKKYNFGGKNSGNKDNMTPYSSELAFKGTFIPFIDPEEFTQFITREMVEEGAKPLKDGDALNPIGNQPKQIEITLYEYKALKANKALINAVLGSQDDEGDNGVDTPTALKYIWNQTDIEKVIVDMPDNKNKYKEIILPPYNIRNSIFSLQARYGLYGNGLIAFMDFETFYILDKFKIEHDYENESLHKAIFNVSEGSGAKALPLSAAKETNNDTVSYTFGGVVPTRKNIDVLTGETLGNKVLMTAYGRIHDSIAFDKKKVKTFTPPIEVFDRPGESHEMTGNKISVEYDELNNPYNASAIIRGSVPRTVFMIPKITDVLLDSFKPNTSVLLKYINNKEKDILYNGNYVISSGELTFTNANPTSRLMTCDARNIELVKI